MKDFYTFTVEILNEYDETDTILGFVIAENYLEAVKNITEYFGGYPLIKIKLEFCSGGPVFEIVK